MSNNKRELEAYCAAKEHARKMFAMLRPEGRDSPIAYYKGSIIAMAEALGELAGPTVAAELLYQQADAQCDRVGLESTEAAIKQAVRNEVKRARAEK